MNRILLFLFCLLIQQILVAQTTTCTACEESPGTAIICEGFENYTEGEPITTQSADWDFYYDIAGLSDDAEVTIEDQWEGENALKVAVHAGKAPDVVLMLGDSIEGRYRLTWKMYIPKNFEGYYNVQYEEARDRETKAYEVYFNRGGAGVLKFGNQSVTFPFKDDNWVYVTQIIDLDKDEVEVWMDLLFVHKWKYSSAHHLNINSKGKAQLGAINFKATSSDFYYVDNICLSQVNPDANCTTNYDPVCVNGTEYSNECEASILGYTREEWSEGLCETCEKLGSDCFFYKIDKDNPKRVELINNFCYDGADAYLYRFLYEWTLPSGAKFVEGTNANSKNPVIELAQLDQRVEVCQKVSQKLWWQPTYTTSYECCITLESNPADCIAPPTSHFDYGFFDGRDILRIYASEATRSETDNYNWEIRRTDKNGNTSLFATYDICCPNDITLKESGTYQVCLTATNECGMSVFCIDVAFETSCTTLPRTVSYAKPSVNGMKATFNGLPTSAKAYNWQFGEGKKVGGTTASPIVEFEEAGNYIVCVKMTLDDCHDVLYCWTVSVGSQNETCTNSCGTKDYNCSGLSYTYSQSTSSFNYYFSNRTRAEVCSWTIDGFTVANSKNTNTIKRNFSPGTTAEVCINYWDNASQCIRTCCKTIAVPTIDTGDNDEDNDDNTEEEDTTDEETDDTTDDNNDTTPIDLNCDAAKVLNCGDNFSSNNYTTSGFSNQITDYSCSASAYTAAERIYYFDLESTATVELSLSNYSGNLDLFLLYNCSKLSCLASSQSNTNQEKITKTLAAGRYYVVVDGKNAIQTSFQIGLSWPDCTDDGTTDNDDNMDDDSANDDSTNDEDEDIIVIVDNNTCADVNAVFCDDFQNYNIGKLAPQSAYWTTWSGNEGQNEDANVIQFSPDGNKTGAITTGQFAALMLPDLQGKNYTLSFDIFIPYGKEAYYSIKHSDDLTHTSSEIYFGGRGLGYVRYGQVRQYFYYFSNNWTTIKQQINLDGSTTLTIGNRYVARWEFPTGYTESTPGNYEFKNSNQLAAITFYGLSLGYEFYIDNILLKAGASADESATTSRGEADNYDELASELTYKVYPNPVQSELFVHIETTQTRQTLVQLTDMMGRHLYTTTATDGQLLSIPVHNLAKGIYLLQIQDGTTIQTEKIIVN